MKIIKRNGSETIFDISKIIAAIEKANVTVSEEERLNQPQILHIAGTVEQKCIEMNRAPSVEEIQEMVETLIMILPQLPQPLVVGQHTPSKSDSKFF